MSNQPWISPNRLLSGAHGSNQLQTTPASNVIIGTCCPPQQLQHIIPTSSPRPSILRKRGGAINSSRGCAKRLLPFMKEALSLPHDSPQTATHGKADPTSQTLMLKSEYSNVKTEESPRKRMRKQQFETDAVPDQVKMAIDVVQPAVFCSEERMLDNQRRLMNSFTSMEIGEKRETGKPRASSRPATVLPIELHQRMSIFVDIDSSEESQATSSTAEPTFFRSAAASVPPVHLRGLENASGDELGKLLGTMAKNDVRHGTVCTAECMRLLSIWQHEKSKEDSSGSDSLYGERSCSRIGDGVFAKIASTFEEKQSDRAVDVLVGCLEGARKKRYSRKHPWNIVTLLSSANAFLYMDSISLHRATLFCCRAPTFQSSSAADTDLVVNRFGSFIEDSRAVVSSRLPVWKCSDISVQGARQQPSLVRSEVASDVESGSKEAEELVDEIISFLAREEAPYTTLECVERSFIRESLGSAVKVQNGHKETERTLSSRKSRARMLLENPFYSVLKGIAVALNEVVGLGSGTLTFSPIGSRSELSCRMDRMNRHLGEQIKFEESVLGTSKHLHSLYDPCDYWGTQRYRGTYDSGTVSGEAKLRSLRVRLTLPPGKLAPDKKLDFGDQCGSIISYPNECELNQHMQGVSPYWRGLSENVGKERCCYNIAERMIHERCAPSYTLRDEHREYYVEDLMDHRHPAKFRMNYYRMEQTWSHVEKLNISISTSTLKKDSGEGESISSRCEAPSNQECVFSSRFIQEETGKIPEHHGRVLYEEMEDFSSRGVSSHEILVAAFRAVHQTTRIMTQTRNAMLELIHNIVEEIHDDEELVDCTQEDEEFDRQMKQAIQESFQEFQSSSKA